MDTPTLDGAAEYAAAVPLKGLRPDPDYGSNVVGGREHGDYRAESGRLSGGLRRTARPCGATQLRSCRVLGKRVVHGRRS